MTVVAAVRLGQLKGLVSSPLTRRPLRVGWYESWRVALRGRRSGEEVMIR